MSRRIIFFIISAAFTLTTSACITHQAKDVSALSDEAQQPESAVGPQCTIGIVQFDNKAPAKVSGVGDAAATILRTQLEATGLKTVMWDESAPDFRLSGAITAYSEVEERIDTIAFQKISIVARVTVNYAFVDIATGKLLMAESCAGEYRKTATSASGLGAKSSFDPNLRDGALRDAFAKTTENIIRKLSAMPFQGRLLVVDTRPLVLKAGTRSQLKEGVKLAVYHVGETLRDPDNGQIPGYKENKIGIIKIDLHQNKNLSEASIISGSGFQVGDIVRPIP